MATSIRLDPAIEQRLDHLATATGRTKAFYLRELVTGGLDALEKLYLAEQRLIEVRASQGAAGKARLDPLQALEEFCNVVEAAGEGSTATDWPQLHAAYLQAVSVLSAAGWRAS